MPVVQKTVMPSSFSTVEYLARHRNSVTPDEYQTLLDKVFQQYFDLITLLDDQQLSNTIQSHIVSQLPMNSNNSISIDMFTPYRPYGMKEGEIVLIAEEEIAPILLLPPSGR